MPLRSRTTPADTGPVTYPRPRVFDREPDDFVVLADIEAAEQRLRQAILHARAEYERAARSMSYRIDEVNRYRPSLVDPLRVREYVVAAEVAAAESATDRIRALADVALADVAVADAESELTELKSAWLAGGVA